MDKGLKEITEDLQAVTPIIQEVMENYPAAKKEAIRQEMAQASEHLATTPFENSDAFNKQSLQEALSISPETMHLFYVSAYSYYEKQEYNKARSLFRFLTMLNPHHVDYWMGLGICFFVEGRIEDAHGTFEIARALDPTNPETYFFIAKSLFMLGKYNEALKVTEDAENISKRASNAACLQSTLALVSQIRSVMNSPKKED